MTRENEEGASVSHQAARWWVVLHNTEASVAEKREFVEWVGRAPERVEACLRIARVHAAVSRPDVGWPQTPAEELIRKALATPEDLVIPLHPSAPVRSEEARRPPLQWVVALAASIIVAAGAGWWLTHPHPERFQTKLGEQRSMVLADGSRVTLNTASKIEVRLGAAHRTVELLQGEVLFDIAHDAKRPFEVHAGAAVVRDVGTQFDIDRRATHTTVTVVEGRVAIQADSHTGEPTVLSAGDRVVIRGAALGALEHDVTLSETTAWTQHELVFRHRPLGEIADEFNRYNVGRIQLRSPSLREQELTGTFSTNDVASFVAVLAGIPGVRVVDDGAGGYIVTSDGPAKAAQ